MTTLNDVIEKVKANKRAFPNGLDTDIKDVRHYLAVISVEPQTARFAEATSKVIAIADNLDCKTQQEVQNACNDVRGALDSLDLACCKALAEMHRKS